MRYEAQQASVMMAVASRRSGMEMPSTPTKY